MTVVSAQMNLHVPFDQLGGKLPVLLGTCFSTDFMLRHLVLYHIHV